MSSNAPGKVLVIACGAVANELVRIRRLNDWQAVEIQCLPAELHNRPERIAPAVERKIMENEGRFERIVIGYADCGSGACWMRWRAGTASIASRAPTVTSSSPVPADSPNWPSVTRPPST